MLRRVRKKWTVRGLATGRVRPTGGPDWRYGGRPSMLLQMQLDADELHSRFEPLFRENFEKFGELGAAVSVWQSGAPIVHLHGGFCDAQRQKPWTDDTSVLIWSATKGLASGCLLHVLQRKKIELGRRVAEFWPEFAQAGKNEITLAQLLSHQAGLAALDRNVDIVDHDAVIEALEEQQPNWLPGNQHGYHARTFGFLIEELVRRIEGRSLSDYWRAVFAKPMNLDLWIGLPDSEQACVATMYAPKIGKTPEPEKFYRDVATAGTFPNRVFNSPRGLQAVSAMNKPEIRALPIASFGGIGSANSLAKFYAMLANGGHIDDQEFFHAKTLRWMATTLTDGMDRVFEIPTAFSAGFMKDSIHSARRLFGGLSQPQVRSASSPVGRIRPAADRTDASRGELGPFGHPGAGGSHAFADPENKIAFAYVMNQMEQKVLPNEKSLRLVDAIYNLR